MAFKIFPLTIIVSSFILVLLRKFLHNTRNYRSTWVKAHKKFFYVTKHAYIIICVCRLRNLLPRPLMFKIVKEIAFVEKTVDRLI